MQSSSSMTPTSHHLPAAITSRRIASSETKSGEGGKAITTTMPASKPTAPTRLMWM